jgi:hypothetical protein
LSYAMKKTTGGNRTNGSFQQLAWFINLPIRGLG